MRKSDSGLRDLTQFDNETLKKIAELVARKTDELIKVTDSVLSVKGTDRITPQIAEDILSIVRHEKSISDIIPSASPKFIKKTSYRTDHFVITIIGMQTSKYKIGFFDHHKALSCATGAYTDSAYEDYNRYLKLETNYKIPNLEYLEGGKFFDDNP